MTSDEKKIRRESVHRLRTSIILLLLALAGVAAATTAWFSISDNGKVNTLKMNITSGLAMKFDLDAHSSIDQYVDSLTMSQIGARIKSEKGFDPNTVPIVPVTTSDCVTYTYENGEVSQDTTGDYLTFTLHFMSEVDMLVHLIPDNSSDKTGTVISSKHSNVASSMRISFTDGNQSYEYDPGMGDASVTSGNVKIFGLGSSAENYNDNNAMFSLTKGVDKAIIVHVWLEGNDENCVNEIKGYDYSISLKFKGTDEHNQDIEKANNNNATKKRAGRTKNTQKEDDVYADYGIFGKAIKSLIQIIKDNS